MSDEVPLQDVIEFAAEQYEEESEKFEGELPNRGEVEITRRASNLLSTIKNVEAMEAHEEMDDPSEEDVTGALTEDAVDILVGVGLLAAEYDLDIVESFRERRDIVENLRGVETREDLEAALEGTDIDIELPTQTGDNVDMEGYNHGDEGRGYD